MVADAIQFCKEGLGDSEGSPGSEIVIASCDYTFTITKMYISIIPYKMHIS